MELPIIATRHYTLDTGGRVTAFLFSPVAIDAEAGDWSCSYRVEGLETEWTGSAPGCDSLDAIAMALEGLRCLLLPHRERLTYRFAEEVGDLAIPELMPGGYGRAVEARLLSVLKAELEKIIAERRFGSTA